ncbi:MAG: GspE/PulE family protein [Acidobacteriota bacterium]
MATTTPSSTDETTPGVGVPGEAGSDVVMSDAIPPHSVLSDPDLSDAAAALDGADGGSDAEDAAEDARQARETAERYGLEYVDVENFRIQNDLFRRVPYDLMLRYRFLPESVANGRLTVVMADPTDVRKIDALEMALAQSVEVKVGSGVAIDDLLQKSESAQRVLEEATEEFRIQLVQEGQDGEEEISLGRITEDQSPIIRLVDSTLFNAIERRASDIHIETSDVDVAFKYRIDGALYQAMDPIDKKHHQTIISRIKVMSELDISEKRVPQDGRFKLRLKGRTIDFRVSILPTVHGEDCVIRVLDKESMNKEFKHLSLDVLGIDEDTKRKLRKSVREPYGMVLVTGPTGSGKTTTLYACINEINSVEDKIITIEDPVEYQLHGVTQIPVNEKKGLTFARGLRSILRHDPDKVMVGEIRDEETAQIAIQSALTGHLVFTTVHANNVVDVLGRFLNMKVDLYNFVSALNCILAQRLVRKICDHCRRPVKLSRALLDESGLDPDTYEDTTFYEGAGCIECNGTGYHGRLAVTELLHLSDPIRELILSKRPAAEIRRAAKEEGMTFLRESALEKVFQGVTTLREINKVTFVD